MENTLENRLKFYAQHLGQEIIIDSDCFRSENGNDIIHTTLVSVSIKGIECDSWIPLAEHTALKLKPISLITDEELIIVSEIEGDKYTEDHIIRGRTLMKTFAEYSDCTHSLKNTNQLIQLIDYLRSKGYALPWMGLSVEKQIEYGWVKLV